MAVELILLEDVKNLGTMGDQIRVAEGYARNFLLPKDLAALATDTTLKRLEAKKLRMQEEYQQRVAVAKTLAEKIAKVSATIAMEAGEADKLYGSVGTSQIAEALANEGIELDRHSVMLAEPIRELGVYTVDIHLHTEVKTTLKVWVVRK